MHEPCDWLSVGSMVQEEGLSWTMISMVHAYQFLSV